MCGICTVINQKDENRTIAKRIFKSLMIDNENRGTDSTGVLAIRRDKSYSLFKDTVKASIFMNRRKFKDEEADVWIGHTRLATTGAVSVRNAHPLERGKLLLVHNGMIYNYDELAKEYNYKLEVDSEILLPIVEKYDWKELVRVRGSFNFIAWNKEDDMLVVERHDNPLYFLHAVKLGIIMISSREQALEFIKEHYDIKDEINTYPEDAVAVMDLFGNVLESQKLVFPKPVVEITYPYQSTVPKKRIDYGYSDREWDNYEDWSDYCYGGPPKEDAVCVNCGVDLMMQEEADSVAITGHAMCNKCTSLFVEAEQLIEDQGYSLEDINQLYPEIKDMLAMSYDI